MRAHSASLHTQPAAVETLPVSLAEAKLFLRVHTGDEDSLIKRLVAKARAIVEAEIGLSLTSTSPAPLRLAVLMLSLRAYERGDDTMTLSPVEAWVAPYRKARTASAVGIGGPSADEPKGTSHD
jgi:hypothetical protein